MPGRGRPCPGLGHVEASENGKRPDDDGCLGKGKPRSTTLRAGRVRRSYDVAMAASTSSRVLTAEGVPHRLYMDMMPDRRPICCHTNRHPGSSPSGARQPDLNLRAYARYTTVLHSSLHVPGVVPASAHSLYGNRPLEFHALAYATAAIDSRIAEADARKPLSDFSAKIPSMLSHSPRFLSHRSQIKVPSRGAYSGRSVSRTHSRRKVQFSQTTHAPFYAEGVSLASWAMSSLRIFRTQDFSHWSATHEYYSRLKDSTTEDGK